MKYQELTEWVVVIKNKDGKERRFKDANSPEAIKFKASGKGPKDDLDDMLKTYPKVDKEKKFAQLFHTAMDAVSNRFPDGWWGDDMNLNKFMKANGFTHADVDKAFKKFGHGVERKGIDAYWDSLAEDYHGEDD